MAKSQRTECGSRRITRAHNATVSGSNFFQLLKFPITACRGRIGPLESKLWSACHKFSKVRVRGIAKVRVRGIAAVCPYIITAPTTPDIIRVRGIAADFLFFE